MKTKNTYVRELHLWYTKTQKQLQDKPMVAKTPGPWQMQAQKNKVSFQQKAQVNADSASSLYLNHLRQRTSRPAMTQLNYYRLLHL